MSYTHCPEIPLKPHPQLGDALPNAVFELDNGDCYAVLITSTPTHAVTLAFDCAAWMVDGEGDAQGIDTNDDGVADLPVLVRYPHVADLAQIAAHGTNGIAQALRDLLLGEPPTDPPVIRCSAEVRLQASVRAVAAVCRAAGTPIDIGVS